MAVMRRDDDLIRAWILAQQAGPESAEYERMSWAADELIEMTNADPERLWDLLPHILELNASAETLGAIGSGLSEDLMVFHGEVFIDRVVSLAGSNPRFKQATQYTFLDRKDVSPSVFKRFIESKA